MSPPVLGLQDASRQQEDPASLSLCLLFFGSDPLPFCVYMTVTHIASVHCLILLPRWRHRELSHCPKYSLLGSQGQRGLTCDPTIYCPLQPSRQTCLRHHIDCPRGRQWLTTCGVTLQSSWKPEGKAYTLIQTAQLGQCTSCLILPCLNLIPVLCRWTYRHQNPLPVPFQGTLIQLSRLCPYPCLNWHFDVASIKGREGSIKIKVEGPLK